VEHRRRVAGPTELNAEHILVTYRVSGRTWEALLSDGGRTIGGDSMNGAGLAEVRVAARAFLAERLGVPEAEIDARIGGEFVQVPPMGGARWQGLEFRLLAPDFGADDPSDEQQAQLWQCYEYYRDNVPDGMRVELYGNRVRIEPGAFGARRAVIDGLAGQLAAQMPDDLNIVVAPVSSGVGQAHEQFRRARLLAVPEGFVRIVEEFEGFEEEGALGVIYLLLRQRWSIDRPW
jgi:hypothetical protein